jgi:hypothetical protein
MWLWKWVSLLPEAVEVELNGFTHVAFYLFPGLTSGDTAI